MNVSKLASNLMKSNQRLILTKYFTSRISMPKSKRKRQSDYIEALGTIDELHIYFGQYQNSSRQCNRCKYIAQVPSEKMTDVNIAVELLTDAFQDNFDTALLVSADSDLVPPVKAVRRLFPKKRIIVAFPPERSSETLRRSANGVISIGRGTCASSLLPPEIRKPDGYILRCPERWSDKLVAVIP